MKSSNQNIPEGFVGLQIYGVYIKGNELVLLGIPDEETDHNCDSMGCGSMAHVLVHCEIPDWQAKALRAQAGGEGAG